jgi:foldase protein PrsA
MRTRHLLIFLLAALALAVSACGGGEKEVPGDAVAVVGSEEISKAQYDQVWERARQTYEQQRRPFPRAGTTEYRQLQTQILQYLVQQAEYRQEADDMGIEVTDEDVEKRLDQIKKQYFGGNEKRYQDHLKRQKLSEDQIREDIEQQLVSEKIYEQLTEDVKVSDDEITEYYSEHRADYRQAESREVRHILIAAKRKPLADRLYQRLRAGADFAALAKRYSTDTTTKTQGGKLTVTRGSTVAPFDRMAFLLDKLQIGPPIKTQYGWHIVQATSDIRPARTTPLKDVKEQIRQQLLQERKRTAITEWADKVKKDYEDEISYQVGYAPPKPTTTTTTP